MIDSSKYVTLSEARQSLPDGYVIAEIPGSDGCLFGVFEKQHIIFKDDDGVWKETDCALEVPQVLSQIVCEIDPDGNSWLFWRMVLIPLVQMCMVSAANIPCQ